MQTGQARLEKQLGGGGGPGGGGELEYDPLRLICILQIRRAYTYLAVPKLLYNDSNQGSNSFVTSQGQHNT